MLLNKIKTVVKALISKIDLRITASVVLGLVVVMFGYGLVKNIKSSQSASAEQIASSPESGSKSRISELYDTLVAKNLGTDSNTMTGMDTLTQDWGTKWNRIKSAALSNTGSGSSGYVLGDKPHINFIDGNTGLAWSYPLVRLGNQVVAYGQSATPWTWSNNGTHNQAVGGKTAQQLCETLGTGWRLPTLTELQNATSSAQANGGVQLNQYRWSNTDYPSNPAHAYVVRWSDGGTDYNGKTSQYLVSCVK